jgi:hypothetical protein
MHQDCKINLLQASEEDLKDLHIHQVSQRILLMINRLTAIFEGTRFGDSYSSNDPLNFVIDPVQISLRQFLDVACLVERRRMRIGSKQALIPLFDLANNAESTEKANMIFFSNGSHVGFIATKWINDGSEVRWNYRGSTSAEPGFIFSQWHYVTHKVDVLFAEDEEYLGLQKNSDKNEISKIRNMLSYIKNVLKLMDKQDLAIRKKNTSDLQGAVIALRSLRRQILLQKRNDLRRDLLWRHLQTIVELLWAI